MKKMAIILVLTGLFQNISYTAEGSALKEDLINTSTIAYEINMKQDLLSLMMAYPGYITGVKRGDNGYVFLIIKNGKKILYDDRKKKSHEQKLADPDIQDMMEQVYPLGKILKLMELNFDPGRAREYNLLGEVYGGYRQQIEKNLTSVSIGYMNCQFNRNNEAAASLRSAAKEITSLIKNNQKIGSFVFPCSGTFNYRMISGTGRLSPHSYGIAIDLARNKKDYWQWATAKEGQERISVYPNEIVEVFEKYNFIWGGKWGHFDILHFEYRPEIIIKARYFGGSHDVGKAWYSSVHPQEGPVKEYIYKIDEALK